MKIRNVDFDFDFLSVSDMERYAAAYKTMQAANTALKAKNLSGIESLRATCAVFDTFIADILGDDYEQKMGIKGDNLRDLIDVFTELSMQADKAQEEVKAITAKVKHTAAPSVQAKADAAARQAAQSLPTPAIGHFVLGDPTEAVDLAVAEAKPAGAVAEAAPAGAIGEASRPFPASPTAPSVQPDFAHMNRAQRRAWVKALKGGK